MRRRPAIPGLVSTHAPPRKPVTLPPPRPLRQVSSPGLVNTRPAIPGLICTHAPAAQSKALNGG
eukprot:scaffold31054_cov51-Isochrysis_galbana.AAC.1